MGSGAAETLGRAKGKLIRVLASDGHWMFEAERLHDGMDVLESIQKSSERVF